MFTESKDGSEVSVISLKEQVIVHEVQRGPAISCLQRFLRASKETLFPDDPFRHFKKHPWHMQFIMAMQYLFPILEWMPVYKLSYLKNDVISGITIASLSIPQGIAYAKLANLPPVIGLYSCFVPPLVYAIFGSSKDLAVGPAAVISIVMGTLIREDLGPQASPHDHVRLAFTATFFAGVFQATLGFLRLGFIIDFLSHAATVGFVSGVAVVVSLQQMKGILGIQKFTLHSDVISVLHSTFAHPAEWNWRTILIGICFLSFLTVAKQISKRNKKLFWAAAVAPVTSVLLATVCVYATHAQEHHVTIVGTLRKGINPPSLGSIFFHGPLVVKGMKIGLVVGLIGLMEAIAVGRTFASLKHYHIDGNKEMIAIGMMNMTGASMSCYITTGAMSRTAVNASAGCKSSVSSMVMSFLVMITLLALTPLFHYTPNVILSVIIVSALSGLIDPQGAYEIWKVDKIDFLACLGAFLGVLFQSIQLGLLIAVGISLAKILLHVSRPHTAVLGKIAGTSIYRNIEQYPKAVRIPGILIIRIDASIYFSNANYIRERISRWIEEEEGRGKQPGESCLRYLIIDLTPVMSIDTSGIHAFEEIQKNLQLMNIQLALANPGSEVIEKLFKSGFAKNMDWIFLTVDDAVEYCSTHLQKEKELKEISCDIFIQP